MSSLIRLIKSDLYRYHELQGFSGFLRGWFKPGFRYTFLFRLVCKQTEFMPFRLLLKLVTRHYRFKYGFEIDLNASIGEGFYLAGHIGTVVIGPVKIGKHCNVAHGVTIGRAYRKGKLGRPTIGDRVWIGTGSVLAGGITVGSDVMIAPNTFLNIDVPDNSVVIGNPARIIPKENPTRHYINFMLPPDTDDR